MAMPTAGAAQNRNPFRAPEASAQQRSHSGHHNRAEAQQAGIVDCVGRVLSMVALAFQSEIDHHDAVLFHNADQQDDADDATTLKSW